MTENSKPKSLRGGKRPGAGRKKKQYAAPTALGDLDIRSLLSEAPPGEIDGAAQRHALTAIDNLVKRLRFGSSDAARVAAANAVLDRGYGKPADGIGGDAMLPFMTVATPHASFGSEIRTEARKYANLAIEVLRRIAEFGQSESASVTAAKSLLDRGLGTVSTAKMPDQFGRKPLGKKEEQAQAAKVAATGRFATPAPPPPQPAADSLQ